MVHGTIVQPMMRKVLRLRIPAAGIVLLLCCLSVTGTSQEPVVREQTAGNPVSFEHQIIRADSVFHVIIPFRLRYDFFVFVRQTASSSAAFTAQGEVSVELIDSTGTSVARRIEQIHLTASGNTPSELRKQYRQDFISFSVPRGRYTIVFTIDDKESKRRFSDTKKIMTLPAQAGAISGLIPAIRSRDQKFTLFNLGGDVLFSQNFGFLFITPRTYTSAVYTLKKIIPDEDESETVAADVTIPIITYDRSSLLALTTAGGIELSLQETSGSNLHYVSIDGSQLRQGRYELVLTLPDSVTLTTSFGARWLDMPLSLSDLDLAIEPLQFITTKSDYSDLRRGSRDSRINKFEEFWKKKDPTPATAYNEVMHEFYRRVDVAVTAFRTLKEMNGAVTDRGKIYILYGSPTSTERLLAPDGAPKEVWKYNSLNKVFTFEDPSKQGNYKLTEK